MRLANRIVLASLNRHKLEEFKALFAPYPEVEIVPAQELIRNPRGLQFVENHDTYLENAIAKARVANHASHYPCLGDDSGIEVQALEGRPGVRSHRYAKPKAGVSQDEANVQLLLEEMRGKSQRTARFVCQLALVIEGVMIHAQGTLEGTLIENPQGTHGFGYDPIFIPHGHRKTLADMTPAEKNAISHRAKAVQELMVQLKAHGVTLAKP